MFFQTGGGFVDSAEETKADAVRLARRAVELDSQDAFSRYALGRALTLVREHHAAIPELEMAVDLNPSYAQAHYALGMALGTSGRPEDALTPIETAMRLSPRRCCSLVVTTKLSIGHANRCASPTFNGHAGLC